MGALFYPGVPRSRVRWHRCCFLLPGGAIPPLSSRAGRFDMRIHWMRAVTAAAVLAAPVASMAQVSAAREQTFRDRDKNHDGVLTLEEYGGHPGNFHAMDANGDGVPSLDEFV